MLATLLVNRLRKTGRRDGAPFVSGSVFTVLGVLAVAALIMFPVWPLPKPSGKFPVGVRSFEIVDASRPGVFLAKPGQPRRLLVRVWYPAGAVSGLRQRPYFTDREARTTGRSVGEAVGFPPLLSYLKYVRTNSYENAPLAPGARRLPVVIYSHGYTSYLGQNTVLMEHLASHGYVVFSLQHTYDSATTLFPNGDVAPVDPQVLKASTDDPLRKVRVQALLGATLDARLNGALQLRAASLTTGDRLARSGPVWLADRIFLHDQLQKGAVPPPIRQIAAAGDLDRVGEMGMSFGGATTGTICLVDRRCAAGINLDGADIPFQAVDVDMPVPFLMFHSDLGNLYRQMGLTPPKTHQSFNEFSYERFATAGTRPDIYRTELRGARHIGLSDASLFMRRPLRDPLYGTTPSRVLIGAQNDFVLGFFDRHLRGVANNFPKPELAAYRDWVTPLGASGVRSWWNAKPPAERAAIEQRIQQLKGGGR
jgi:predicted dienelactone hydrolase